ncbi:MAG: hypothetical protein JNL82_03465 [Myxococcales bacterium]|nr:hypothetical protein [Myxococcales bacterium]
MELEHLEALALADDRAAALAALLPGTVEHDYWHGVQLQHQGRLDEVDALLAGWHKRHGRSDELQTRLRRRQLLLRAGLDLAAHADALRFEAGLRLDDQAEAVAAAQRHPGSLDPALLDPAALLKEALARGGDLSYVTDWALGDLLDRDLDPARRRDLLQRLRRANHPAVVRLVAADLGEKSSRGFGGLPAHDLLTRAQLDELAALRPELRRQPAWVHAALERMHPPAHLDHEHDPAARAAWLAELWAFAEPLAPAFNGLKARILYHQLDLDRRQGRLDRARFLRYLALPRDAHYARRERLKDVPGDHRVGAATDADHALALAAVGDDEPLIREHLAAFLLADDGDDFSEYLRADWLDELRAEVRLLAGAAEPERWAAALGPTRLAALRDRVDLELTVRNPERVAADADVALEVDVKNVPRLVVKTFRIDPVAYYLARRAEVDTSVDLDGMVASDEQELRCDLPAIRRTRLRVALPACARPGTYVVELIGNGKSSRALIRKGALRHSVRVGLAGPTVRVLDEQQRPLADASLWLGDRRFTPRDDGAVSIPFSTAPSRAQVLLVHGDVAQLEAIPHPAESYEFTAGFHLERESLVPGKTARALVRPQLTLAEWPATLALVEDPQLEIAVTDRAGTTTSKTQPIALHDDAETPVEFIVPEDAASLALTVRGRVRVVSSQQTLDVSASADAAIGRIHSEPHTEALHLASVAGRHELRLLGKTGEPRGGRAIPVTIKAASVGFELSTTLETDADGRIDLGELREVEHVAAALPSGAAQRWTLWPEHAAPRALHLVAGPPIVLPRPPGAAAPAALALYELRGGEIAVDVTDRVTLVDRALRIDGLVPGVYLLQARGAADVHLTIVPADAPVVDGWAAAGPQSVELSPATPVLASLTVDDASITATVVDAGPHTRVHAIATRYRPDRALPGSLQQAPRDLRTMRLAPVLSHYVSGRDIGDEYRYVLERRGQPRRPGVLLDKPGLLLNPWAVRTTSTGVQQAKGGGNYHASAPRGEPRLVGAIGGLHDAEAASVGGYVSLNFLAAPAVVLANLRPDERGVVRIDRADLGAAQHLRLVVVDAALTSTADLALPAREARPRDLRLRLALDPAGHFSEERRVDGAPTGSVLVVEDTRSGKLELVDTTARAHQILVSLGAPEPLREFSFVAGWHALDEAARRARYSKYACHELHLFLHFRDPAFFARVVRPFLAHKRHKTFVDRWLLGDDLAAFLDPSAFARLNALERVLLARRLHAEAAALARLIGDEVDLVPPDPERDARLVDTLLGAAALDGEGLSADAAADELTLEDAEESRPRAPKEKAAKKPARASRLREIQADEDDADGFGGADDRTLMSMVDVPMERERGGGGRADEAPASARRQRRAADNDRATVAADLRERGRARPLYRSADRTQEWAESDWWHVRAGDVGPGLVPVNRFWRDLAAHDPARGPFLSPHLGECTTSFAAALCALAVLDLPFVAGAHVVARDDTRLSVTTASPALAARAGIAAVEPDAEPSPVLVGQSYFRGDDRWQWDGAEQREKYVTGELLVGVVYVCQVVVTNPTSRHLKLALLLQIPRGAVPVHDGFYTRTLHLHLGGYGTQAFEYSFYFPLPGRWPHFPAHVSRAGQLVAFAAATELEVVTTPRTVDAASWAHVSQHGTTDEVLAFLDAANLGRVDLARVAWRMHDRDAFTRVLALLSARHVYHDRLWAYALLHHDRRRAAEWLRHQTHFLRPAGPALARGLVELDPIERAWYEHLEYAPLINARAHQLGARRQILNDALAGQWRRFLDVVAHRPAVGPDDRLAAAHYLFALDRTDEALAALARVDRGGLATGLQYDYLAAYAACCRGDLAAARALASPWQDHPVDRWRARFAALLAMLDEAEGRGPAAAVDADSREQRMDELAARQPALDLSVERGALVVQHHNVAAVQLRYYRMDLELLFSRQPFVQGDVGRFGWIEPGAVQDVALAGHGRTRVDLPEPMRGKNLVVEAVAPGLRRAVVHYAHDLAVQVIHAYGQVQVLRATDQAPLPATYVKVYARAQGGAVGFYKDGYTDLRGRFDYATLSTDDLDRVERFAILVVSDDAGATVLEAPPPPR